MYYDLADTDEERVEDKPAPKDVENGEQEYEELTLDKILKPAEYQSVMNDLITELTGKPNNTTVSREYTYGYGDEHPNVGKLTFSLKKTLQTSTQEYQEAAPGTHTTDLADIAVERYTLTVTYTPDPVDENVEYHTTEGGSPGVE